MVHTWHPWSWVASEGACKPEASLDNLWRPCLRGEGKCRMTDCWTLIHKALGFPTGLESLYWDKYGYMGLLVFFLLTGRKHSDRKQLREERVSLAWTSRSQFIVEEVRAETLEGNEVESVEECYLLAPFQAYILLALLYVLGPLAYICCCHSGLDLPTTETAPHRHGHRPIWLRQIQGNFLFLGYSWLCKLTVKVMAVHSYINIDFKGKFLFVLTKIYARNEPRTLCMLGNNCRPLSCMQS